MAGINRRQFLTIFGVGGALFVAEKLHSILKTPVDETGFQEVLQTSDPVLNLQPRLDKYLRENPSPYVNAIRSVRLTVDPSVSAAIGQSASNVTNDYFSHLDSSKIDELASILHNYTFLGSQASGKLEHTIREDTYGKLDWSKAMMQELVKEILYGRFETDGAVAVPINSSKSDIYLSLNRAIILGKTIDAILKRQYEMAKSNSIDGLLPK